MFESISRSIEILKKSFGVLMGEKKLLVFPLISGLALIAIFISFLLPAFAFNNDAILIAALFAFYLAAYFIVIFFNSALVHAVSQKIEGKEVSITGSISFTFSKIFSILGWAIIAATVGLILSMLRSQAQKNGGIGAIVASIAISIVGMAWSLATFFVVPIIVFEGAGPISAIRRSIDLIKKSWGEQMIGSIGIGGFFLILYLIGIGAILLSIFVLPQIMIVTIPLVVVYFAVLFILQGALEGIFVTELYRYSTTGQAVVFKDEIEAIRSSIKGPVPPAQQ
jgi:hypothetical protein